MDPQPPATDTAARSATEPSQPQPPKPSPPLPPPSSSSTPPISAPNPNPTPSPGSAPGPSSGPGPGPSPSPSPIQAPNPKPPTPTPPQPRPPQSFNRALPPPSQPQFPHFSSAPPASSAPGASAAAPRGGMAIGVPAHHQSPSPPFSSSFGQHFGGLGRTGVNVAESASSSSTSQVRTPVQGMGMLGSQMRPSGIAAHPQRPVQSSLRPPSSAPNTQPAGSQSFQGHGLVRPSSVGSPATPSPSASQSVQSLNQPWLSSGPQGKPPLPSTAYRQQLNPQSMQQRSHIPPPLQSTPTSSQQAQPQQPLLPNQSQEHFGQQVPPSRALHMPHQQQVTRLQGPGNQKPSSLVAAQSSAVQSGIQSRLTNADTDESSSSILGKRSVHDLVNQVDPLEKLEPEVADILVDIAENFLESITRSGCSLAKHRKSTTLEAKDILLHLEKNWNMTLPGFGGDEIKSYRRPIISDIHKERLAAIKKSIAATEAAHGRGSAGQASGSAKGGQAKTSLNIIGSPNFKNS